MARPRDQALMERERVSVCVSGCNGSPCLSNSSPYTMNACACMRTYVRACVRMCGLFIVPSGWELGARVCEDSSLIYTHNIHMQ